MPIFIRYFIGTTLLVCCGTVVNSVVLMLLSNSDPDGSRNRNRGVGMVTAFGYIAVTCVEGNEK